MLLVFFELHDAFGHLPHRYLLDFHGVVQVRDQLEKLRVRQVERGVVDQHQRALLGRTGLSPRLDRDRRDEEEEDCMQFSH